jgi:hypothetical protein
MVAPLSASCRRFHERALQNARDVLCDPDASLVNVEPIAWMIPPLFALRPTINQNPIRHSKYTPPHQLSGEQQRLA